MYTIKTFLSDFSAAHRLRHGYLGRCANLHGHNYRVQITLAAEKLNEYGLVADFVEIKEWFNTWLNQNWDHGVILDESDTPLKAFVLQEKQRHFVVPKIINTSVECLAEFLFHIFTDILSTKRNGWNCDVKLMRVELWESSVSSACFEIHR